ncbi:MAG: Spy/CpxP family protein refolding chaperone [Pyrinomonadaceae bacterium]
MSLKTKFFSILTAAISVAAFSVFSFGQDSKPATTTTEKVERHARGEGRELGKRKFGREGFGGKHGRREGMMGLMRDIKLTDAQKEQIKAIRLANKPDRSNFEAMRTIMSAKRDGTITADQEAQLKAFKEQARAKGQLVHQQIEAVLTAEQKAQIETRKQEMKQKREEFRKQRELRKANPPAATTEKPKVS